jgi:hypothetical protein
MRHEAFSRALNVPARKILFQFVCDSVSILLCFKRMLKIPKWRNELYHWKYTLKSSRYTNFHHIWMLYAFVGVYVNLCTVTVIELIVFSCN